MILFRIYSDTSSEIETTIVIDILALLRLVLPLLLLRQSPNAQNHENSQFLAIFSTYKALFDNKKGNCHTRRYRFLKNAYKCLIFTFYKQFFENELAAAISAYYVHVLISHFNGYDISLWFQSKCKK